MYKRLSEKYKRPDYRQYPFREEEGKVFVTVSFAHSEDNERWLNQEVELEVLVEPEDTWALIQAKVNDKIWEYLQ